jgi:hypothetical protein
VKEEFSRTQVRDEDLFFASLQAILRGIEQEELEKVLQAWAGRIQEFSEGNGDYVG